MASTDYAAGPTAAANSRKLQDCEHARDTQAALFNSHRFPTLSLSQCGHRGGLDQW